jgi:hypothetical protein
MLHDPHQSCIEPETIHQRTTCAIYFTQSYIRLQAQHPDLAMSEELGGTPVVSAAETEATASKRPSQLHAGSQKSFAHQLLTTEYVLR